MNELMLLSTMRMVREPGIFEPIAIVLGKIYNMLFNGIYGSVSAGALGIARARQTVKEGWAEDKLAAYREKKMRLARQAAQQGSADNNQKG